MANLSIIRRLTADKNITLKELSGKIGISENGLQRIIKSNSTKIETLEKIADILEVPVTIFFRKEPEYDTPGEFIMNDYSLASHYSSVLINSYDKISDKIEMLRDLYVAEVFYKTSKGVLLGYPIRYENSPVYIFDLNNHDEKVWFSALREKRLTDDIFLTPFSSYRVSDQFILQSFSYFFEAFHFILFLTNTLNIKDYLNEGLTLDEETMRYWKKYKELDEQYHFS